jgi:hypothetical protein
MRAMRYSFILSTFNEERALQRTYATLEWVRFAASIFASSSFFVHFLPIVIHQDISTIYS